uniref:Phosphoesterase, PA-phosphatase related n=1 Tax=Solibacter usitatus (strain Ellin6076) TaxID=234267 RepID=Q029U2_SOLUE
MIRLKFHPTRDYTLAALTALAFAWIAYIVPDSGPTALDVAVRAFIHSFASPALTAALKVVTQLGGGWFLFPLGTLVVLALYSAGRRREAALFTVAVLGANILDEAMKLVFHRTRPDPWFDYPLPRTYSFPSGHSFVSFCFYFALAEILVGDEWPRSRRLAVWIAAALFTLAIGLSRAYLGVHYPTDVLAGYIAAVAWTTVIRIAHHTYWAPV